MLFFAQASLFAATQGSAASNSSRGSVAITLEIPEATRISAEVNQFSSSEQVQLCLHVSELNKRPTNNVYTVAGLEGNIPADYNIGASAYEKSAQTIKFSVANSNRCNYQSYIINNEHIKNHQALLLIMIAE